MSRSEDSKMAAAAGWDCFFCSSQREAEEYVKAYTSLPVRTQQQLHGATISDAPMSQQQKFIWLEQQMQHQQLPRMQPQLLPQDPRRHQQRTKQVIGEQQSQKEQGKSNDPVCLMAEDLRKTQSAEASSGVPASMSATCPPGYTPSGRGLKRIETATFPASRAACAGEADCTARAYVSHLTFHREDKRTPSPERVALGFVKGNYVQNLQEREERLNQVAVAAAREYTRSLYPAQAARLQCLESGSHIPQAHPYPKTDTSPAYGDVPGDSGFTEKNQGWSQLSTALQQQHQQLLEWRMQQPEEQHQCESAPTTEVVPVVSTAVYLSAGDRSQPQIVAGRGSESVERLPTDADPENPSEGAAVVGWSSAQAVIEDFKPGAWTLDGQCAQGEVLDEEVTPSPAVYGAEDAKKASLLKSVTDAKQEAQRPLLQCKACAEYLSLEAQRIEGTSSATHRAPEAVQKTSNTSKLAGTTTNQKHRFPLSIQTWLDEQRKLHLE